MPPAPPPQAPTSSSMISSGWCAAFSLPRRMCRCWDRTRLFPWCRNSASICPPAPIITAMLEGDTWRPALASIVVVTDGRNRAVTCRPPCRAGPGPDRRQEPRLYRHQWWGPPRQWTASLFRQAAFPALTQFALSQFNNGQACTMASVTCVLASTVQGVNIHGGAANAHPALGRGWEGRRFCAHLPARLHRPGDLLAQRLSGRLHNPQRGHVFNNSSLYGLVAFYPGAGYPASQVIARRSV